MSKIEWTGRTWNPATGCTKVSPGCKHCYAERMALRLKEMGQPKYASGFEVVAHPDVLAIPLRTKKPTTWFVNSMSDLFHEQLSAEFIGQVFDVMQQAHWHTFQVLTKRSARLREMGRSWGAGVPPASGGQDARPPKAALAWPKNVWMGVSVENDEYLYRVDDLRATGAAVKFLSIEPLLGPLSGLDLAGIDWVIVGGESGPGARSMKEEWVVEILAKCHAIGVPFFFKQWGGVNKKKTGRLLLGRTWDEIPMTV
jgi:protein gp37